MGIDISPQMIKETSEEVHKRNIQGIELYCMDAEHLDFPDNHFDLVFCGFALFFLPSIPSALSEFKRVLKPGGKLVVSTWGRDSNLDIMLNNEMKEYPSTKSLIATPLWSKAELYKVLQEAQFENIQIFEEIKIFLHQSAEDLWSSLWSHATRAKLEQLTHDQLAELRQKVQKKTKELENSQGIPEDLEVFYAISQKARS